jgi:hypothetical protein
MRHHDPQKAIRLAHMIAKHLMRGGYEDGGTPTADDDADYAAAVAAGQNADLSGATPLTIYANKPDTSRATVEGADMPPQPAGGNDVVDRALKASAQSMSPAQLAKLWTSPEEYGSESPDWSPLAKDVGSKFMEYTAPRMEDFERGSMGPSQLVQQGIKNMRSGEPWRMLLGAGQDVLGTVSQPFAPVAGAFEAAKGSAERTFGPAAGHAVDVASNLNPDFLPTALAKAAHYTPELAMAGMGIKAANPAVDLAKDVIASPRVTNDVGLYSHGAEAAAALPQAKGTPDQFKAMLQKAGVKLAEFENSGYDQAFAGQPSITRDQVVQHFQDALPKVEEKVLGHNPDLVSAGRGITEYAGNPKFQKWTLPGGENYREVLLKLPDELTALKAKYGNVSGDSMKLVATPEDWAKYKELSSKNNAFQSSHWDDPNVLAHLRMADRTGPNGEKILHVEEIQSDWGQQGKKEGFAKEPIDIAPLEKANEEARVNAINASREMIERESGGRFNSLINVLNSGEPDLIARVRALRASDPALRESQRQAVEAERALVEARISNRSSVPVGPYVTNTQAWTDLALKRALKEAAEGGYDKLVWTPGAKQAKRYSLASHVDELRYIKNDDGTYNVVPFKGDRPLHNIERENIPEKELEGLFGRDVAEKMRAYEGDVSGNARALSGQNLEVGGEGMKGYYDKIVPKRLQELVKKHDPEAKIETHDLITKKDEKSKEIADEASLNEIADEESLNENSQLIKEERFWDDERAQNVRGYRVTSPDGQDIGFFEDLQDAHDALLQALVVARRPDTIIKVPSVKITPKMRASILRGQTAFQRGGTVANADSPVVDRALALTRALPPSRHMPRSTGTPVVKPLARKTP